MTLPGFIATTLPTYHTPMNVARELLLPLLLWPVTHLLPLTYYFHSWTTILLNYHDGGLLHP